MPCYHPLNGWMAKGKKSGKKHQVVFEQSKANLDQPIQVPCGQCIGCKLERSRQWAMRCVDESTLHDSNCFITLTYSDENLPHDHSLDKTHWQLFMKKFRERISPRKIRFFMCGEYGETCENCGRSKIFHEPYQKQYQALQELGEQCDYWSPSLGRPHYHACIFGYDFPDRELLYVDKETKIPVYTSALLEDIWDMGQCTIGELNWETAAYTARYCTKKITGELEEDHYVKYDWDTGEIHKYLEPEFALMSRRPGIGKDYFQKYKNDFNKDFITKDGVKMQPPKYYDKLMEELDPETFHLNKLERKLSALENIEEQQPKRLRVKESIKLKKLGQLSRGYDYET